MTRTTRTFFAEAVHGTQRATKCEMPVSDLHAVTCKRSWALSASGMAASSARAKAKGEPLGGDDSDIATLDLVLKEPKPEMAKRFKWPVPAAERQKLLLQARKAKEWLSSSKVAELSICDLKATVNGDKLRVVCLTMLQRMLQPSCEAVYGVHLRLPSESLGLDTSILAGKARKRTIAERGLQVKGRPLYVGPLTCRKERRCQGRQSCFLWFSGADHCSSRNMDAVHWHAAKQSCKRSRDGCCSRCCNSCLRHEQPNGRRAGPPVTVF